MSNIKWSDTLPTVSGMYWFYGELHMGSMGMDYHDDYVHKPSMTLVKVMRAEEKSPIIVAEGGFVSTHAFDKSTRREGWLGYWTKAILPEPPYDGNDYFKQRKSKWLVPQIKIQNDNAVSAS